MGFGSSSDFVGVVVVGSVVVVDSQAETTDNQQATSIATASQYYQSTMSLFWAGAASDSDSNEDSSDA